MASGAGLNRLGQNGGEVLLANINAASTVVATPLVAYGTIGANDSGTQCWEGIGYTKWVFQLIGGGTGYSVTAYGTIDSSTRPGGQASYKGSTTCPASSWFPLPGPTEQTGTGGIANPLTATTPLLIVSMPLVAVRVVLTASATPTGAVSVICFAVP